jgi:mono/diheme cytochrome c family protein
MTAAPSTAPPRSSSAWPRRRTECTPASPAGAAAPWRRPGCWAWPPRCRPAPAPEGQAVYQQVCIACHQAAPWARPAWPRRWWARWRPRGPARRARLPGGGADAWPAGPHRGRGPELQQRDAIPGPARRRGLAAVLNHVVRELAGQSAVPAFELRRAGPARTTSPGPKALRAQRDAALAP